MMTISNQQGFVGESLTDSIVGLEINRLPNLMGSAKSRTQIHDGIMGIGYASYDSPHWEDHTGVQVPLYAAGPRVDGLPHYLLQSDIFHIVATHLGLGDTWPAE